MSRHAPIAALLAVAGGLLIPATLAQQTNAPAAVTNAPPATTNYFDASLTNGAPTSATNTAPASTSATNAPGIVPPPPAVVPDTNTPPAALPSTPLVLSPLPPADQIASPSGTNTALVVDTTGSSATPATTPPPATNAAPSIPATNTVVIPATNSAPATPVTSTTNTVTAPSTNTVSTITTNSVVTPPNTDTNALVINTLPPATNVVVTPSTNAPPATSGTNTVATTTATTNPPTYPSSTNTAIQQLVQSPQMLLSDAGYNLIVNYEVGDQSYYVSSGQCYPTWPEGDSGVTVGFGVDLGYTAASRVISDWSGRIPDPGPARLSQVAGIVGSDAKSAVKKVRDILISWNIAKDEFEGVEVPDEIGLTEQAFPGAENLRINALSALVATVYNRGTSMTGSSRVDMRTIRQLVPNKDYEGMAEALEHMVVTMGPTWKSEGVYDGLRERYLATAKLMRTP